MFDRIKAMFPTTKPKQIDKLSADKMERFKRLRKFAAKRMEGHARIEYLALLIHLAMEDEEKLAKAASEK